MNHESSDFRRTATRVFRRSLLVAIPFASVIGLTVAAYAAIKTFKPGDPLSSTDLNANFTDVQTRLTTLESASLANALSAAKESQVIANDTNGAGAAAYGSTDTAIFRFKTELVSTGTGITHASTAASGDTFTINEAGLYSVQLTSISQSVGAAGGITGLGITVNELVSERTASIVSIDITHRLIGEGIYIAPNNRAYPALSGVYRLKVGDVVRAHGTPGDFAETAGPFPFASFTITKVTPLF